MHANVISSSLNQKFNSQFTINFLVDNNELPIIPADQIISALPHGKAFNSDGSLNWMLNDAGAATWTNPYSYLNQRFKSKTSNLITNLVLSYRLLPNLEFRNSIGYNNIQGKDLSLFPWLAVRPDQRSSLPRNSVVSYKFLSSWIVEPQLIFKQNIGKGKLDWLNGSTLQQRIENE